MRLRAILILIALTSCAGETLGIDPPVSRENGDAGSASPKHIPSESARELQWLASTGTFVIGTVPKILGIYPLAEGAMAARFILEYTSTDGGAEIKSITVSCIQPPAEKCPFRPGQSGFFFLRRERTEGHFLVREFIPFTNWLR